MAKELATTTVNDDDQLPDYLRDGGFKNEDNFDNNDVVVPRIKLLQGISPEVDAYDAAKNGHFWHTGLDMSLGEEISFVVADRRKKYLLSAPITDGQGVLARADDAMTWDRKGSWTVKMKNVKQPQTWTIDDLNVERSGLAKWGSSVEGDDDSPPAATLFYDYLVWLPEHPELGMSVISLARSAIKPAKKGLNDKIKMHGDAGRPMQALIFKAKSFDDNSEGQEFKNWKFLSGGFLRDPDQFKRLREYVGALSNMTIKDEDDASDNATESVDETAF